MDTPACSGSATTATRKWNWSYRRASSESGLATTSKQWTIQVEPAFNDAGQRRAQEQAFDQNDRLVTVRTGLLATWNSSLPVGVVTVADWQLTTTAETETHSVTYDKVGNKLTTTDPLGRVTTMTYDLRNRATSVTDPLGRVTSTAYDFCGNKTLVTLPDAKTQQFLQYDAFGQAWQTIDERGNLTNLEYSFGPMKKLSKVTTYRDKDAGGTEPQPTTFWLDGLGREWKREFPDGTYERTYRGIGGDVIGLQVRRRPGGVDQIKWMGLDARQRETANWWDGAADVLPVNRVWDKAGRLTSIANNISTITYCYDAAGQLLAENTYIAGAAGSPGNGLVTTYQRYPNGTVRQMGYPNGNWFRREYNARGELTAIKQVDPNNPSWSWTVGSFSYYPDGKPFSTARGNGAGSCYFYDGKGNLSVSEHFQALGNLYYAGGTTVLTLGQSVTRGRYTLGLKPNGNLVLSENGTPRWASGTSNGNVLIMQGDGNLVLYASGGVAVWSSVTYGNAGAQFVFQEDGNLVVYSSSGQVKWASNTAGTMGGSLARRDYERDNRDRIVSIVKGTVSGQPLENGRSDRFVYDDEGQLTAAYYDAEFATGTPSGMLRGEDHFVYDALGNRKSGIWQASWPAWVTWTRRDTTDANATMNGLNQVKTWLNGLPANWDDHWGLGNGNLIQDGNFTAWYNALNQPMWYASNAHVSGTATFLAYDPLGRCVKRWTAANNASGALVTNNPATYYYYEGWNLIQEGNGTSNAAAQIYVHGARVDEIVARFQFSNMKWYFPHYDGRTHCQLVTSDNAEVKEQYQYEAFGTVTIYNGSGVALALVNGRPASAIGNRFLFTGREWLADWGVYDYRHRQYHPAMGRFVQPDPKHFGAGDYNLYRYCHNDPVNKTDPSGLDFTNLTKRPVYALRDGEWVVAKPNQTVRGDVDAFSVGRSEKTGEATAFKWTDPFNVTLRERPVVEPDGSTGSRQVIELRWNGPENISPTAQNRDLRETIARSPILSAIVNLFTGGGVNPATTFTGGSGGAPPQISDQYKTDPVYKDYFR